MKKTIQSLAWLFAAGAIGANEARADVRLPALVSDHMVLQRNAPLRVWGWADPKEQIRIEFHNAKKVVQADANGRWIASLGQYPAGGPYEMRIKGKNEIVIHDILVGDVWLTSGQSNAGYNIFAHEDGIFEEVNNAAAEIASAYYPRMRLFKVKDTYVADAKDDVQSTGWKPVTPDSAARFSAVAYFFGRELHRRHQIPIGLIQSTKGGTIAEAWISSDTLGRFPEWKPALNSVKDDIKQGYVAPTMLFNGMINPLTNYNIKGALFYQGESNVDTDSAAPPKVPVDIKSADMMTKRLASNEFSPLQYQSVFPALIRDWRRQWGYNFPFLFVQLAGYASNNPEPADYPRAAMREAQSFGLSEPNTAMATAIDLGEEGDVHPKNKQDVAHRLVLAAEKLVYKNNVVSSGPAYRFMHVEGDHIRIHYKNTGSGLEIKDNNGVIRGFEIAGADGHFVWAQARQDGDNVLVSSQAIREPRAVRYNWRNTPDGNLYNREGLPALPFRTDAPKLRPARELRH